jgi:drug/metabolite transporter (DMT)-like permease
MRRAASPHRLRRIGWGLIFAGAVAAALGTALRDRASFGDGPTYLLDTLGFLLAVAGAVLVARVGAMFLEFSPRHARRVAILQGVVGIAVTLAGCSGLGATDPDGFGVWLRPLVAAALVGGIGVGLAGLLTLAWFYGLDWAADRMAQLDQAEVEERRRRIGREG